MKNFKNIFIIKRNNSQGLFLKVGVFALLALMSVFSGQAAAQQACMPATTVTEGDLGSNGIASFVVSSGPGSVTVDHVDSGSGLQSLTEISSSNAVVNIPSFTPGTFDPTTVTFTVMNANLPVDFRLRAASATADIFIRVRCGAVHPMIISDDPSMSPGGPDSFEAITAGIGTLTVDSINGGTGLQTYSTVNSTNVVVEMPNFTPGSYEPHTANFTVVNRAQPAEFTLRAANQFHGVLIKVLISPCGNVFVTDDSPAGSTAFFNVSPPAEITPSGSISVNTVNDNSGLQSLTVMSSPNASVNIPSFTPGTLNPVAIGYSKIDPNLPACMTIRAASGSRSILFITCIC